MAAVRNVCKRADRSHIGKARSSSSDVESGHNDENSTDYQCQALTEHNHNNRHHFSTLPMQVLTLCPEPISNRRNHRKAIGHNEMVPIPIHNRKPMCFHM